MSNLTTPPKPIHTIKDLGPFVESVHPDEVASGLLEIDLLTPDYRELHRYQVTYVIREDKPRPFAKDLGASTRHSGPPMRIPAHDERGRPVGHTVGELWDIADYGRRSGIHHRLAELKAESSEGRNIIKTFLDRKDMVHTFRKRNPVTVKARTQ